MVSIASFSSRPAPPLSVLQKERSTRLKFLGTKLAKPCWTGFDGFSMWFSRTVQEYRQEVVLGRKR